MSEDLTPDQISLLCEIGESAQPDIADDNKQDLERIISGGYAEQSGSAFRLTTKGLEFLGKRGAGLNEA